MKHVLLINSPNRTSEPPRHYPYGLAILSTLLINMGHETDIFDGNFASLDDLTQRLNKTQYDFIGISGLITTFNYQRDAARVAKFHGRNAIVASGGGLASAVGKELLLLIPELDILFIGEAERSLPDFLTNFDTSSVAGIVYRDSYGLKSALPMNDIDSLDNLPFPDLNHWAIDRYFAQGSFPLSPRVTAALRRVSVLTSRGCPYNCDFCFNILGRHRIRYRSVENVLEEITDLVKRYNIDFISFLDESFLLDKKRVTQIAEGIKQARWTFGWGVAARPTSIDAEILHEIKSAGCDFIYYGFDSGSPETLERMNKCMTVDDCFEAFRQTVEAEITPVPNIIIGYDNETLHNIEENYRFLNRLRDYGESLKGESQRRIFECGFNNFGAIYFATPYPGSELYKRNRDSIPPLLTILERISGKDAYEFSINVSKIPDRDLISEQRKMESFVRNFRL